MSISLSYSVVSEFYGLYVLVNVVLRCFENRLNSKEPLIYKYTLTVVQAHLYNFGISAGFGPTLGPR